MYLNLLAVPEELFYFFAYVLPNLCLNVHVCYTVLYPDTFFISQNFMFLSLFPANKTQKS